MKKIIILIIILFNSSTYSQSRYFEKIEKGGEKNFKNVFSFIKKNEKKERKGNLKSYEKINTYYLKAVLFNQPEWKKYNSQKSRNALKKAIENYEITDEEENKSS